MSLALRHEPGRFGLALDDAGWTQLGALVAGLGAERACASDDVLRVVRTSDKQRFEISPDGLRIRAVQGHTVPVSLGHPVTRPPAVLYHGTVARNVGSILANGLTPGERHDVHLTERIAGARLVAGRRAGVPVVLEIDAGRMAADGIERRLAPNGTWLTRLVPAAYVRVRDDSDEP